jgi:uncharacterized peroxidase-related enzyme
MPYFPSLPPDAGIGHLWSINPEMAKPFNEWGKAIMRGNSPLTARQREFIAAFVSAINGCDYCYNGHAQIAVNLGADRSVLEEAVCDIDSSGVEDNFKPVLHLVRKLTLRPSDMTQADADSVYKAGWDERGLQDIILVACRFNFMNRLSLAHGLDPDTVSPEKRAANMSYAQP